MATPHMATPQLAARMRPGECEGRGKHMHLSGQRPVQRHDSGDGRHSARSEHCNNCKSCPLAPSHWLPTMSSVRQQTSCLTDR